MLVAFVLNIKIRLSDSIQLHRRYWFRMSSLPLTSSVQQYRPWFYSDRTGPCGDRRWLSLVAGILLQAAAGSAYAFGLYSNDLKLKLGLT